MKLTLALLFLQLLLNVVSASAAHDTTAVRPVRVLVTLAPVGAEQAESRVGITIVRAVLDIDQVLLGGFSVAPVASSQLILSLLVSDLNGRVVLVLQVIADLSERRQLQPAGLHATRARDAMALALDLDHSVDGTAARLVVVNVHQAARLGTSHLDRGRCLGHQVEAGLTE